MRACPRRPLVPLAAVLCLAALAPVRAVAAADPGDSTAVAPAAAPADSAAVELSAPRLVDRVIAIVDEEMILQSDLDREIELYQLEKQYAGEEVPPIDDATRKEVLDRLVESKLIIAAAKQADIQVEESVVERSVDEKIAQLTQHFGTREALEQELARNGMTLDDYRDRLTAQITDQNYLRAVISRFIRPDIEVMENEISAYYEEHRAEMPSTPDSVTLGSILVPVQPSEEARREVQRKVAAALKDLRDGKPFAEVARARSEGPNAGRGGVLGVIQRGQLSDPQLESAVFTTAEGAYSQPVVSQQGVHIIRIDAVTPQGRAVSQIFFPLQITRADIDKARAAADEAYRRVTAGEPFSLVASEVSADPASARNGGHLGTFRLQDLSPQFQEALADMKAGDMTEPILTPAGFYIFLVKDRVVGHELSFDDVKDDIRRAIEGQKLEKALSKYVEGLRSKFFVDLKT